MKILYINDDENLLLSTMKAKLEQYTMMNGTMPDRICMNNTDNYERLLKRQERFIPLTFRGVIVVNIK